VINKIYCEALFFYPFIFTHNLKRLQDNYWFRDF